MGQLKERLLHASMPHTWLIYMLKQHPGKRSAGLIRTTCRRKSSSRSKKSPGLPRKQNLGPGSPVNESFGDIHFLGSLKRSPLEACRRPGPCTTKQANSDVKQGRFQDQIIFPSEPDRKPQHKYECTISPKSVKAACSSSHVAAAYGEDKHTGCASHRQPPHKASMHNSELYCARSDVVASTMKSFRLDVQELERKLNDLKLHDKRKNDILSPLRSVSAPSPSLDEVNVEYVSNPQMDSNPASETQSLSFDRGYNGSFTTAVGGRVGRLLPEHGKYSKSGSIETEVYRRLTSRKSDLKRKHNSESCKDQRTSSHKYCDQKDHKYCVHSTIRSLIDAGAKWNPLKEHTIRDICEKSLESADSVSDAFAATSHFNSAKDSVHSDLGFSNTLRTCMEEAEVSDMRSPENDETVKLRQDDIFRLVQFTEDKRLHNQISDPESEKSVTPPECSKDHGGRCFELRSHLIRTMSSKSTDSIVSDNTFSSIETISSIEEDFCLRQAREITLASRNGDSLSKRSEYLGILRAYDHEFHPEESVRNTDSVPLEFTRERYRKAHVIPHGRAPCDKNEDSEAAKKATIMDVIVGPASSIFHDTYTQSRSPHRTMASGEESISDMIHIVTNDSAMIKDSPCESPLPQLGRMGEISNGTLSSKSVADVHSAAHRSKHHNINLEVSKAARLDKYPRCRNRNGFRFRLGEGTLSEIHRGIAAAGGDDDEDDGDDDNDDDDDYDDDDAVNLHDEYDDDVYPHDGDDGDCDDAQEEKHKADFYGLHCSCFQGYTENDDSDPLFRNRLILNDADDSSTAARRPMMKRRFSKTLHISPRNGESELWTSKWRSSRSSAPQAHLLPEARNVSLKQSNEVSGSKQNECKRWSRNHRRTRGSRRRTLGKGQRILSDQLEESSSGYKAEGESDEQKTLFTNGNLDHHHRRQQHYLHCHPHCLNHHHPRRLQAQVVWSYDMKRDFKEAMMANVQNIVQSHDLIRDIRTATQKVTNLRKLFSVNEKSRFRKSINYAEEALMKAREARFLELLQNYLVLNRRRHHPAIISAFRDVCKHLNE